MYWFSIVLQKHRSFQLVFDTALCTSASIIGARANHSNMRLTNKFVKRIPWSCLDLGQQISTRGIFRKGLRKLRTGRFSKLSGRNQTLILRRENHHLPSAAPPGFRSMGHIGPQSPLGQFLGWGSPHPHGLGSLLLSGLIILYKNRVFT